MNFDKFSKANIKYPMKISHMCLPVETHLQREAPGGCHWRSCLCVVILSVVALHGGCAASFIQVALAQWSYDGPTAGCTDVLDPYTSGERGSSVSGSAKAITVNATPSFLLHGPGCSIRGAFTLVFDVGGMRAAAVVAGTALNVSIGVVSGVHFVGLRDPAAASSTWPLRLPMIEVHFGPLGGGAGLFDPDALPVDVAMGGVSWIVEDAVFSIATAAHLTWPLLSLRGGQYVPRGSRIAITNTTATVVRCSITSTFSKNFFVAVLGLANTNPLTLLDRSQLLIENVSLAVRDTWTVKVVLKLTIVDLIDNSPLTLRNSSLLIVDRCALSAVNASAGSLFLSVMSVYGPNPVALREHSRLTLTGNTATVVNTSTSSNNVFLYVLICRASAPVALFDTASLTVTGNNALTVVNSSSAGSLIAALVSGHSSSAFTLNNASTLVVADNRNTITAINTRCGSAMYLVILYMYASSPLTLQDASTLAVGRTGREGSRDTPPNNAVTVVRSINGGFGMFLSIIFGDSASAITLRNTSQMIVTGNTLSATEAAASSNVRLVVLMLYSLSPLTLHDHARLMAQSNAAAAVRSTTTAALTVGIVYAFTGCPVGIHHASMLALSGTTGNATVVNCTGSSVSVGGLLLDAPTAAVLTGDARVLLTGLTLRAEGVVSSALQVLGMGSLGSTTATVDLDDRSRIVIVCSTAFAARSALSGSGGLAVSLLLGPTTRLWTNHSGVGIFGSIASADAVIINGTILSSAAGAMVGAVLGTVTEAAPCLSSATAGNATPLAALAMLSTATAAAVCGVVLVNTTDPMCLPSQTVTHTIPPDTTTSLSVAATSTSSQSATMTAFLPRPLSPSSTRPRTPSKTEPQTTTTSVISATPSLESEAPLIPCSGSAAATTSAVVDLPPGGSHDPARSASFPVPSSISLDQIAAALTAITPVWQATAGAESLARWFLADVAPRVTCAVDPAHTCLVCRLPSSPVPDNETHPEAATLEATVQTGPCPATPLLLRLTLVRPLPQRSASTATVVIATAGLVGSTAYALLCEPWAVEPLVLVGVLDGPCAPSAVRDMARLAIYALNPFAPLGPVLAGTLLVALVALVVAVNVACAVTATCRSPTQVAPGVVGRAFFPRVAFAVAVAALPGVTWAAAAAIREGPSGAAVLGLFVAVAYVVAVPCVGAWVVMRLAPARFAPRWISPSESMWPRVMWPSGRWITDSTTDVPAAMNVRGLTAGPRGGELLFVASSLLATSVFAITVAPPASHSCAPRHYAVAAFFALSALIIAVLRPHSAPLTSLLTVLVLIFASATSVTVGDVAGDPSARHSLTASLATTAILLSVLRSIHAVYAARTTAAKPLDADRAASEERHHEMLATLPEHML